jgi:hypothetical protein
VAGFCAANAPTDMAAAKAALLVINANRFFTEPFLSLSLGLEGARRVPMTWRRVFRPDLM